MVAFGDSITDGAHATMNQNHRWPDYLAARLAADPSTKKAGVLGVVNVGIGGNRVLLDGYWTECRIAHQPGHSGPQWCAVM